jgi:hypothetical protein
MATLQQLLTASATSKDAGKVGPTLPDDSLTPPRPHSDLPGIDDHVGWNAPRTPPGVDTLDEQKSATQAALDAITAPIEQLAGAMEIFAEFMRQQRDREQPTFRNLTLGTGPQIIHTEGRPYNALIIGGSAGQTLTVLMPGQDSYTKTLVVGWNILNIPEGTMLSISTGSVNAQLVRSYTFLGTPL